MLLRLGILPSSCQQPVDPNCSLLWSRCLVAREIVSVAQHTLEGSSSPGWGSGAAAVSSFRLMCSRGMLGTFTTSIRHQEKLDLLLLAAYSSPTTATDLVPQDMYGLQLRCAAGDAGQLDLGELCESWRTCPTADAGQLGEHLEPEHIVPCAAGLGAKAVAHYDWGLAAANVALQLLHTWRQKCSHCGERRKMLVDP